MKVEDLKAYIETGILELYVLGDVTPDEKRQVEEMASKHPEVKAELGAIELSMELYAKENAVEPSENLRGRILGSLLTNLGDDRNFTAAPSHTEVDTDEEDTEEEADSYLTMLVGESLIKHATDFRKQAGGGKYGEYVRPMIRKVANEFVCVGMMAVLIMIWEQSVDSLGERF